ncbi:MAG: thiol-disulfide oxidoreductase DCC family protein [Aquabacterium sp.]|nr:thiol-disulfide oxidoreductase DCC family protein [Ferruginibacter sp.]
MNDNPVILFDGVCNLCNGAVDFVIKRDTTSQFKFAALQSEAGQKLLQQYNLPRENFNSFVLIKEGKVYTKSAAALKVCKHLTGLWPILYGFIIVPSFIRNAVYQWIAKNRYKWFGKKQQCMLPTAALKNRFL